MNDNIHVGDVCVVVRSVLPQYPVGSEIIVLEILAPGDDEFPGCCYVIDRAPGAIVVASAQCLRKKRPPSIREALGEWELCPWRPSIKEPA
jgi:hypothetical protein